MLTFVSLPAFAGNEVLGVWVCSSTTEKAEEKKIGQVRDELLRGKDPEETFLKNCTEMSLLSEEQILKQLPAEIVGSFPVTDQPDIYYLFYRNTIGGEPPVLKPAIFWKMRKKEKAAPSEEPVWEDET